MNKSTNTEISGISNYTVRLHDCECRSIVEPLLESDPHPPRPPFSIKCADREIDTMGDSSHEMYMVHGSVWRESGACECKLLCIGCLERGSVDYSTPETSPVVR